MATETARSVIAKHESIHAALEFYEKQAFEFWGSTIKVELDENLEKSLYVREDLLLRVNFDPKVVALLREVKYFGALGVNPPEAARAIYARGETFRKYIFALDNIATMYNHILKTVLPVEAPLIMGKVAEIDSKIQVGITELNWKSEQITAFIADISPIVSTLSTNVLEIKNNLNNITKTLKQWASAPLIDRKDGKKLLNLEENETKIANTVEATKKEGVVICELVEKIRILVGESEDSLAWQNYKIFVDQLIVKGFRTSIKTSLEYLITSMVASGDLGPFLEVKFELESENLLFTPSMDSDAPEGLSMIVEDLVESIFNMASLLPRIYRAPGDGSQPGKLGESDETYYQEMVDDEVLNDLRETIAVRVSAVIESAAQYKDIFEQYSYLWTENRQVYLKTLLQPTDLPVGGELPSDEAILEKFDHEIRKFDLIQKTINALEGEVYFNGWLKVDEKPLKVSLGSIVKKWALTLTKHLSDDAINTLNDLNTFIRENKSGLVGKIEEGDYDGLIKAMGLLHAIKNRSVLIDKRFEPLRKTVNLLRQFSVELPEEVHKLLNDLPEEWSNVKKLAATIKNGVAPLQAKEVDVLQQRCNKFEMKNHNFREEFRKKAPFKFEVGQDRAYKVIDLVHFDVLEMEHEATTLRQSCELFELGVPLYRQLVDCRRDVSMLKTLWDLVALVNFMFDQWKKSLWTEIDTDAMEARCKELSKDLRKLDKEIKGYDAYSGLDQMVKDMITSLRAVGELRSNAIRDRHWKQLMKATGVTFVLTANMQFQDLLSLQLHKNEDDVKSIVDKATKELSMEKVLNDLDKTWAHMELTYEVHASSKSTLLKSSEELIETLEDNQVMLQTMMTSKYVAHFEEQITKWQISLSTVDAVIVIWLEVQQTWSHLENIFMGSEDIRAQLPEDSKRFDGIDAKYKLIMQEVSRTPNCVAACTRVGLFEEFEKLQGQLALCEKSLAEYLETKRLAFPRFYFVSASDLLDILAKGNLPQEVAIHLPKLFDSISMLKFEADTDGKPSKRAIGMFSREDEYVQFKEPCDCVGAVESWLNKLVDTMRLTLRSLLGDAVATYEEKPREQWIFDYPAQITLAGSQIWWTTEVTAAFGRLEEGYENSLKDFFKKQVNQLTALIGLIQGTLTPGNRQMIMSLCTLDVHARDMVVKLITEKAESATCFSWQSQLRLRWDDMDQNDCFINICDASFRYNYEYLGNTPRLVITALTDRCYITLTQSLHLIMGGAPAGPAGTGKTETVKDLGKALAIMVFFT